jgi:hypothetical protein
MVLATSERFLPAGDTYRVILASESHWLQPVLVLSVRWWPTPASVGRVIVKAQEDIYDHLTQKKNLHLDHE